MRIRVLFFGVLKETMGKSGDAVELREGATVGELLEHYGDLMPALKPSLGSLAVAVNREYAGAEAILKADDEVALLPPVSGGCADEGGRETGQPPGHRRSCRIVREAIDSAGMLACMKCGEDGAAVVFEGVVRNQTRGRRTIYLDYEAYEEMALRQMESLAAQAIEKFEIRDAVIVHRLGRLRIGETSVLIVVVSAHRAAGFDACRWIIETLKKTVPIWKKEYFEDGAVWADGEAFPEGIPRAGAAG
jgi:molybdopterin synthase catalytic subunit